MKILDSGRKPDAAILLESRRLGHYTTHILKQDRDTNGKDSPGQLHAIGLSCLIQECCVDTEPADTAVRHMSIPQATTQLQIVNKYAMVLGAVLHIATPHLYRL